MKKLRHKILIVLNPTAGSKARRRSRRRLLRYARRLMREGDCHIELAATRYPAHATEIARNALGRGYDHIVATGGDGTVNETAAGLVNSGATLAIVPMGSGNGLARHLDIPLQPLPALHLAATGASIAMDCGTVNGRPFFTTAGLGFDAEVGWMFSSLGKRGIQSYIKATVQLYLHYKPKVYEIVVDGKTLRRRALMVTVANASQFGNNARIAPTARVDDGLLELVIVHPFPKWAIGYLATLLFQGRVHKSLYVETISFTESCIRLPHSARGHVDGEPVELPASVDIRVMPSALRVVAGPNASEITGRPQPLFLSPRQLLSPLPHVPVLSREVNRFLKKTVRH